MLTYFQVKITTHLLNHIYIYIFNGKAPFIYLFVYNPRFKLLFEN